MSRNHNHKEDNAGRSHSIQSKCEVTTTILTACCYNIIANLYILRINYPICIHMYIYRDKSIICVAGQIH